MWVNSSTLEELIGVLDDASRGLDSYLDFKEIREVIPILDEVIMTFTEIVYTGTQDTNVRPVYFTTSYTQTELPSDPTVK